MSTARPAPRRRGRTIGRALRPAAAALLLAAAACGTTEPGRSDDESAADAAAETDAPASGIPEDATIVSDRLTAQVESKEDGPEFRRTLLSTDQRASEFVSLAAQPGTEARERRELARSALEAVAAQHLERFLALAADASDPTRRRIAVKALAFTADPRATPVLVSALGDASDAVLQTGAAFALAHRADAATPIPDLLGACAADDVDVRVNALLALWHVLDARRAAGPPLDAPVRDRALAVVENALFDPQDPMARGHAAAAMGALGDARGVDPLLNLLRDTHPFVRTHTAAALGKLGDRRALRPLAEAIDETPRGTARGTVLLGISVLLEREGVAVPPDLPAEERAWTEFLDRTFPRKD